MPQLMCDFILTFTCRHTNHLVQATKVAVIDDRDSTPFRAFFRLDFRRRFEPFGNSTPFSVLLIAPISGDRWVTGDADLLVVAPEAYLDDREGREAISRSCLKISSIGTSANLPFPFRGCWPWQN
jgi:hypothetical protein